MTRRLTILLAALPLLFFTTCAPGEKESVPAPATPSGPPDAVTADPNHYKVEFENDVVRVLRVKYAAGSKSVMHSHPAYCGVGLTDTRFKITMATGEVESGNSVTPPGRVGCVDAQTHLPENLGGDAEGIYVELKNRKTFDNGQGVKPSAPATPPDAVTADPKHYTVKFENDTVRVLEASYPPGAKAPMHAHPANCTVELTAGKVREKQASGEVTTSDVKLGEAGCGDGLAHQPENIGDKTFRTLIFELKNRRTFK